MVPPWHPLVSIHNNQFAFSSRQHLSHFYIVKTEGKQISLSVMENYRQKPAAQWHNVDLFIVEINLFEDFLEISVCILRPEQIKQVASLESLIMLFENKWKKVITKKNIHTTLADLLTLKKMRL